ncbi:hypothetical protein NE865_04099 [Phthorimaea operculella]|nr:hypothetical protein NE865_04099 [Phthorimaea operculella]
MVVRATRDEILRGRAASGQSIESSSIFTKRRAVSVQASSGINRRRHQQRGLPGGVFNSAVRLPAASSLRSARRRLHLRRGQPGSVLINAIGSAASSSASRSARRRLHQRVRPGGVFICVARGEISLRLANTESLLQEYESVQLEIESYLEEDEISDDELEQFQTRYYSIVALAKHLSQDDAESSKSSHHSSSSFKSLPKNNYANNAVKLPTISLPSFDGSVENWLEYRDTYLSLIHNNDMLGAIQKFHYLRSSLTGSALQVIKSLEFSETNYATAWELLEGRFNNKRLLIHNHVKALFAINNINKESPSNLRKLIDHILKNLRALEGLGEPTSHWDTLIIHIVTSKLDSVTEREWEQHKSSLLGDTYSLSHSINL